MVTLTYLTITTVLSQVAGLPFEIALAIGFLLALLLHFTLQRRFVWTDHAGFALPMRRQVVRYLAMTGTQYGCTAASTAILPGILRVSTELVYLGTIMVIAMTSFLIMRFAIFHGKESAPGPFIRLG
jgi:putative flippase GtrA